jgi:hypothetical protein
MKQGEKRTWKIRTISMPRKWRAVDGEALDDA